ncbi:MAG: hypothetical protein AB7S78_14110 [Candidatus Omnitrophota bacterium]
MIKIYIHGGLVQSVRDASGHIIPAEVWDTDTEGLACNDPQLKTGIDGEEYYVYEP